MHDEREVHMHDEREVHMHEHVSCNNKNVMGSAQSNPTST